MIMTVPLCASTPAHGGRTPRNDVSINFMGACRSGPAPPRPAGTWTPDGRRERNAHMVRISRQSGNAAAWCCKEIKCLLPHAGGGPSWGGYRETFDVQYLPTECRNALLGAEESTRPIPSE